MTVIDFKISDDSKRLVPNTLIPLSGNEETDNFAEKYNKGIALSTSAFNHYEIKLLSGEKYLVNKASLLGFLDLNKYISTDQSKKTPEERGICFNAKALQLHDLAQPKQAQEPTSSSSFISKWCTKKTLFAVGAIALTALALGSAYYFGAFETPAAALPPVEPRYNIFGYKFG